MNMMKSILTKLRGMTKRHKIIMCCCVVFVLIMIAAGIVFWNYQEQKRQAALEEQKVEEPLVIEREDDVEEVVEDVVPQTRNISFTGTSIAKDLKIKIIDEQEQLVSGVSFVITVTPATSELGKEYNDHDKDGIIYIKNLVAGEYTVRLHEIEGFAFAANTIAVTVKEKAEYKKVDVGNEIKQANEVDIQKEDKPVEKPKEETTIVNTVKLVDSTKKENPVKREDVDVTALPKAKASEKKFNVIHETTTFAVPESVVLYNQDIDEARSCVVEYEISDESNIIQGVSWKVEPEGIFTFEKQEGTQAVQVSAVKKGKAELRISVNYDIGTAGSNLRTSIPGGGIAGGGSTTHGESKEICIQVTVSDYTDENTLLKDKNGNVLYLDKDAQKPATSKDYVVTEQFYTTPSYTGWQTIDGKSYYYDENHKAVTGVQVIGGARYHFGEDGKLLKNQEQRGIDVSKWNGKIDWNAVAQAGIDFAIIRAGNRGSSKGNLIEDPRFKENIQGATKAGIKVGVYIYSQAITEAEAIEEASMALTLVQGYKLQLPIYFDTEHIDGGRANSLNPSQRTAIAKAFCETVRNAGYMPGIYSNYYWLRDNLKMSQLDIYSVWVAHYKETCGYPGKYDMWQYTSKGRVPGINGDVDLNISYVGY